MVSNCEEDGKQVKKSHFLCQRVLVVADDELFPEREEAPKTTRCVSDQMSADVRYRTMDVVSLLIVFDSLEPFWQGLVVEADEHVCDLLSGRKGKIESRADALLAGATVIPAKEGAMDLVTTKSPLRFVVCSMSPS